MDADVVARRVVVHGHVQGVFFRDSTRERATSRGVVGWVRNDPGGSVTAHLQGAPDDVAAVEDWIRGGGPPRAVVDRVEADAVDPGDHHRFRVAH